MISPTVQRIRARFVKTTGICGNNFRKSIIDYFLLENQIIGKKIGRFDFLTNGNQFNGVAILRMTVYDRTDPIYTCFMSVYKI